MDFNGVNEYLRLGMQVFDGQVWPRLWVSRCIPSSFRKILVCLVVRDDAPGVGFPAKAFLDQLELGMCWVPKRYMMLIRISRNKSSVYQGRPGSTSLPDFYLLYLSQVGGRQAAWLPFISAGPHAHGEPVTASWRWHRLYSLLTPVCCHYYF